jgi:curli biogenesis system outer membrane secretion channel CsgG
MVEGILGDQLFRTGELPGWAATRVTQLFYRQLTNLQRCEVLSTERITRVMRSENTDRLAEQPRNEAVRLGNILGVHAVVIGGIYRFEQREGSGLGVEKPASVAFDAHLVRVHDDRILWSAIVDKTQQSLSENLLRAHTFVKGGGQWMTAERLAEIEIESALKRFPYLLTER